MPLPILSASGTIGDERKGGDLAVPTSRRIEIHLSIIGQAKKDGPRVKSGAGWLPYVQPGYNNLLIRLFSDKFAQIPGREDIYEQEDTNFCNSMLCAHFICVQQGER